MATSETLPTPDGPMPTYRAEPVGPAKGAIVVIQEAFGLTDHIQSICRRLADAGWIAMAPALYHRDDSPVFSYGDFTPIGPVMGNLGAEGIASDLDAVVQRVRADGIGADRTGVVGFCMGGTVALVEGTTDVVGAAVTFYGGGVVQGRFGYDPLVDVAPRLRAPWLGLFGDLDQGIPPEQVEALRAAAATAGVPTEVVRYADAGHGFNCDDRDAYHPASAADAWSRTLAWFDQHLTGG